MWHRDKLCSPCVCVCICHVGTMLSVVTNQAAFGCHFSRIAVVAAATAAHST